jgi:ribosomal protein S8
MKQKSFNEMISQVNRGIKNRRPFIFCTYSVKNIMFLNLLLQEGLILGFFQTLTYGNSLCVFLKYWDNKPIFNKINFIKNISNKSNFNATQLNGYLKTNTLSILSTSINGFFINTKYKNFTNNHLKIGGKIIANLNL